MFIVQIAGHLGKDPEVRFTPSGQKVSTFTLATKRRKGREDVTIWVRVTVWGDRLDKVISCLKKGSAVIVIGRMDPPSPYTDKEGRAQASLEVTAEMIEFSPFGKGDQQVENQSGANQGYGPQSHQGASGYSSHEESSLQSNGASPYSRHSNAVSHGSATEDDTLPF